MPYFKVILYGRGIRLSIQDDLAVGFFTTRVVRADDLAAAELRAQEQVLTEWAPGTTYAQNNEGSVPSLAVEDSFPIGWFSGTFGRKPAGYSFFRSED